MDGFCLQDRRVGIATLLRNHNADFRKAYSKYIGYKSEPREVKVKGILESMLFTLGEQISEVDFKSDCRELVGCFIVEYQKSPAKLAIHNQCV